MKKQKRISFACISMLLLCGCVASNQASKDNPVIPNPIVNIHNSAQAVMVAAALVSGAWNESKAVPDVEFESMLRNFHATLRGDIWAVTGASPNTASQPICIYLQASTGGIRGASHLQKCFRKSVGLTQGIDKIESIKDFFIDSQLTAARVSVAYLAFNLNSFSRDELNALVEKLRHSASLNGDFWVVVYAGEGELGNDTIVLRRDGALVEHRVIQ